MVLVVRLCVFWFFLGSIVMYHCTSHNISVSKSRGGVLGSWLLWEFVVGVLIP